MSRYQQLRVFCYDVSDDRRRRRVAKLLEEEAVRVQYSVFEARMSDRASARLAASIEAVLAESDSLRVYTIGRSGETKCDVRGAGVPIETSTGFWMM
ncbi:CRISPR-associated endonuclease Cas2 [Rhizobium sp. FKY42]|uniref:CRISPR-associated endonuclease Cas2 n=1 Tax=Rhizobium sp. FKY42 TaxID=2562310 RepID=UPI0010C1538F|nr:CRISPR-associated endonuclease Cas2 [Rhizobium sp. FKY42]